MSNPGTNMGLGRGLAASWSGEGLAIRTGRARVPDSLAPVLQLLDTMAQVSATESPAFAAATSALVESLRLGHAAQLETALGLLSPDHRNALQRHLGRGWEELQSLSHERDARIFHSGLLQIAANFEDQESFSLAGAVLGFVSQQGDVAPELQARARSRLDVLEGRGAFAPRLFFQFENLTRHAADPGMVVGFGAGAVLSSVVRLGMTARLLSSPAAAWLGRPGIALVSSSLALAAEVPAVWAASHTTNLLLGAEDRLNLSHAGDEMASLAFMIGGLRVGGAAFQGLFRQLHGLEAATGAVTRLEALTRVSQPLFQQAGMLSGILLSRWAESRYGLRRGETWDAMLSGGLLDLLHFNVGGFVADRALGSGFRHLHGELGARQSGLENPWRGLGFSPSGLTAEGFRLPLPEAHEEIIRSEPMMMSGTRGIKTPGSMGLVVSAEGVHRTLRRQALQDSSAALSFLSDATPAQSQKLISELHRSNRILPLILEIERNGYEISVQDMLLEVKPLDYSAAAPRLRQIESEFASFYEVRRNAVLPEQRWKIVEAWQREMYPSDPAALGRLMRSAKRMGVPDLFNGAFDLRRASIDLKARVRANQALADYFYDLSLVRDFLVAGGFHAGKENAGRRLAELLINGQGNCVTLSLLFSHLARGLGHELNFGLLPDHMYLMTKMGGAIESTVNFGLTPSLAYQRSSRPVERGAQDGRHMFGFHLLNLGKIFIRDQNIAAATEVFDLSARLLPTNPRAPLELGRVAVQNGDITQAAEYFRRVYELFPEESKGYGQLRFQAWAAAAAGDLGAAERLFKRMNSINSSDADVYRGLHWIYQKQGRRRDAEQIWDVLEFMEGS